MNVTLGQVVYSRAGRDSGRLFLVSALVDESYVLIVDGDLRRIEKPKKKKIKHLKSTGYIFEPLKEKFESGLRVSNSEIRKALENIKQKIESAENIEEINSLGYKEV
ncbi:MAG TPA: RNA-binding protein [Clostridiaceae bacterium]|nr:RNA-binding protein [Clostridiaceae bacterium]